MIGMIGVALRRKMAVLYAPWARYCQEAMAPGSRCSRSKRVGWTLIFSATNPQLFALQRQSGSGKANLLGRDIYNHGGLLCIGYTLVLSHRTSENVSNSSAQRHSSLWDKTKPGRIAAGRSRSSRGASHLDLSSSTRLTSFARASAIRHCRSGSGIVWEGTSVVFEYVCVRSRKGITAE